MRWINPDATENESVQIARLSLMVWGMIFLGVSILFNRYSAEGLPFNLSASELRLWLFTGHYPFGSLWYQLIIFGGICCILCCGAVAD